MKNKVENSVSLQEAFETIRDYCRSRVDGCSNCLFCGRIYSGAISCILPENYPCDWQDLDTD